MATPGDIPESPCVRNCCLDEADVCIGCGRHLMEILAWNAVDAAERQAILDRAAARRAARPPLPFGPPDPT
jgi:uncharacterized protein